MGMAAYSFSNLWIESLVKAEPIYRGRSVIISGSIDLTLRCTEYPPTATKVTGKAITNTLKMTADVSGATIDTAQIGAKVELKWGLRTSNLATGVAASVQNAIFQAGADNSAQI